MKILNRKEDNAVNLPVNQLHDQFVFLNATYVFRGGQFDQCVNLVQGAVTKWQTNGVGIIIDEKFHFVPHNDSCSPKSLAAADVMYFRLKIDS